MAKTRFYHEYDLFLPVGRRKTPRRILRILAEARGELISFFGGLTESFQHNRGSWKVGPLTVRDEIRLWHVMSAKGREGDRFLKHFRQRLENKLKQDLILIVRHEVTQI